MINLKSEEIQQLVEEADGDILSLYLLVDPGYIENQAATAAWRIWLKTALRNLEDSLADDSRERWATIRTRLDDYFADYTPSGKTLALFLGPEMERTYEIPVRLDNNIAYGEPLVTPLLWAMDEYQRYLVVRVTRDKATFLSAYLGSAGETDEMTLDIADYDWHEKTLMPAQTSAPGAPAASGGVVTEGSHRDAFKDMIDAHVKRFYKDVARRIQELADELEISRIVFGGSEKSAHVVRDMLPKNRRSMVVDILPIPMQASEKEVLEQVLPQALDYERKQEANLVEDVINRAKANNRGALGRDEVLKALENRQVDTLVAPWPLDDEELARTLPLRAMESSSTIELVHGEAAERLKQEGGLGAKLYYTMPTT